MYQIGKKKFLPNSISTIKTVKFNFHDEHSVANAERRGFLIPFLPID
jgi:hypothetical protein